jgi:hypothetical protein
MNINGDFNLVGLKLIKVWGIEDKEVLIDVLNTEIGKMNVTESTMDRFLCLDYRNVRDKLMEIDQAEYESIDFSALKDMSGDEVDDEADEDDEDDEDGEDTSL